jgi:23S rRNA pseudouridine1911/1915/1917 synthase
VSRSDEDSGGERREAARRLARVVHSLHPELSFSRAKRAVLDGQVLVDGERVTDPGQLVPAAADVRWVRDLPAGRHAQPTALVHADADVAVADKPAGLLSVPTPARERDTLVSRVTLSISRHRGSRTHVSVVHRLDRDTSGLLVFALSRRGLSSLQAQLLDRSLSRIYDALVSGVLPAEAGTVDRALIGDGVRRRRRVVRAGETGKPAVTHWQVTERFADATRVRVSLETGRTHQIRIHLAAAGHPVLGDRVYRAPGRDFVEAPIARQALHATELGFQHPRDDRSMRFRSPPPADFEQLLAALRRGKIGR